MKIKIRKNEALFSQEGLHILDEKGIAVLAQEDIECDIAEEHFERVKQIVIAQRLRYGLDENRDVPVVEEPAIEESIIEKPNDQNNDTLN